MYKMKTSKILAILLSVSLGANLYFAWLWSNTHEQNGDTNQASIPSTNDTSITTNHTESDSLEEKVIQEKQVEFRELTAQEIDQLALNEQAYLDYLQQLAKAKEFELLEYQASNFLRNYPTNTDAMMLEALAYYHTMPLNVALVHYKDLLSQPLSDEQSLQVKKILNVNTTRVIQQFTGDQAWDLLAVFLEPLVQVDPTNRQYLMALARAYGMQSQLSLMEAVLANFRSDDARASRLRDNILARLNNNDSPASIPIEQSVSNINSDNTRIADLTLNQSRGQFIAKAKISDVNVDLLLDTGASTTAISNRKFVDIDERNTEFLGLFTVNTAGGTIQAPIYKITNVVLGDQTITSSSVLILPEENLGRFDGLLGMNILSQFDLAYDAGAQTMKLYRK